MTYAKNKIKVWSTAYADQKFREYFVSEANPINKVCAKCGLPGQLQVSHFWTRNASCMRYNLENCDLLHYQCHYGNLKGWEYCKQGEYRAYKIKQLGREKYRMLEKLYYQGKTTRREAIINLMKFLKPSNEIYLII